MRSDRGEPAFYLYVEAVLGVFIVFYLLRGAWELGHFWRLLIQ